MSSYVYHAIVLYLYEIYNISNNQNSRDNKTIDESNITFKLILNFGALTPHKKFIKFYISNHTTQPENTITLTFMILLYFINLYECLIWKIKLTVGI